MAHSHSQPVYPSESIDPASKLVSPIVADLVPKYGPGDLLSAFFAHAVQACERRGVFLSCATLDDLALVNKQNQDSWGALMPMFEPAGQWPHSSRVLVILGRNANGEVVATQAARFYDLSNTNLLEEAESLRLFFGEAPPKPSARCLVRSSDALRISGRTAYSGSGWYRKDFRRRQLSAILPRISRAYALTRWNCEFTVSFIDWVLVEKGVAHRYGYRLIDDGILLDNIIEAPFQAAIAWMRSNELLEDLAQFLSTFDAQVDAGHSNRSRNQEFATVRF